MNQVQIAMTSNMPSVDISAAEMRLEEYKLQLVEYRQENGMSIHDRDERTDRLWENITSAWNATKGC